MSRVEMWTAWRNLELRLTDRQREILEHAADYGIDEAAKRLSIGKSRIYAILNWAKWRCRVYS